MVLSKNRTYSTARNGQASKLETSKLFDKFNDDDDDDDEKERKNKVIITIIKIDDRANDRLEFIDRVLFILCIRNQRCDKPTRSKWAFELFLFLLIVLFYLLINQNVSEERKCQFDQPIMVRILFLS